MLCHQKPFKLFKLLQLKCLIHYDIIEVTFCFNEYMSSTRRQKINIITPENLVVIYNTYLIFIFYRSFCCTKVNWQNLNKKSQFIYNLKIQNCANHGCLFMTYVKAYKVN